MCVGVTLLTFWVVIMFLFHIKCTLCWAGTRMYNNKYMANRNTVIIWMLIVPIIIFLFFWTWLLVFFLAFLMFWQFFAVFNWRMCLMFSFYLYFVTYVAFEEYACFARWSSNWNVTNKWQIFVLGVSKVNMYST